MKRDLLRIFKFGGASVKSAQGVMNLAQIIKNNSGNIIVVVSAMGKTTNAFERVLAGYMKSNAEFWDEYNAIKDFHLNIANELFSRIKPSEVDRLLEIFRQIEVFLREKPHDNYNFTYDQLVSYGEIISSTIVSAYLNVAGVGSTWVDIRQALRTDTNYREGNINYSTSNVLCSKSFDFKDDRIFITQGFIAGADDGTTTTLGREGSDYTAAILANLLDADSVTIWKDVSGVLNADPRVFPNAIKLNEVSFKEAIELAYCGAQIIHPKTIKPLQNKQIPLYVKSFLNSNEAGTKVYQTEVRIEYPPILIKKTNQVLITLTPRDFSFVIEDCLSKIFSILCKHRVKANLVQSSAIDFSICVDNEDHFLPGAIRELKRTYSVKYNKYLELLTIRHYTRDAIDSNTKNREILLRQLTRSTARFVMVT